MIVDSKVNKGFVGAYLIDGELSGSQLGVTKKPTWLQRFLTRIVLGWKWADLNELKRKENVN